MIWLTMKNRKLQILRRNAHHTVTGMTKKIENPDEAVTGLTDLTVTEAEGVMGTTIPQGSGHGPPQPKLRNLMSLTAVHI